MTAMPVAQHMTADEYLAMEPDRRHTELIGGEFVVHQPRFRHQALVNEINFALATWTRAAPARGVVVLPLDVKIDDDNVLAPDLLWYSAPRVPADEDWPYPLPDLAVEVRSPSTWRYDIGAKKRLYEQHRLPELWLLDGAADAVLVFRRSTPRAVDYDVALEPARGDALTSPLLPGFALALDALFAP